MKSILKYFPDLTDLQISQLRQLGPLYKDWNSKINVVSRKDIDNIYPHHILHSLGLAMVFQFNPGAEILDLGTGGGLPGIPLAILFPEVNFLLVDSIGKKIKVTQEIVNAVGLKNVKCRQIRAEELNQKFDFVITRAVAVMPKLISWTRKIIRKQHKHAIPNGIWALKGIDRAAEEAESLGKWSFAEIYPMSEFFDEPYFETKCVVYIQK